MSTVDQFESVFKAAAKTTYQHEKPALGKVVLVTDLEDAEANLFLQSVRDFFGKVLPEGDCEWEVLGSGSFGSVKELLGKVEELRPDLLVTYRNLGSESWRWPYSLGEHLDVLTQVTTTPVLVLPHPDRDDCAERLSRELRNIMAVSGHLCGEGTLIRYASTFTPQKPWTDILTQLIKFLKLIRKWPGNFYSTACSGTRKTFPNPPGLVWRKRAEKSRWNAKLRLAAGLRITGH